MTTKPEVSAVDVELPEPYGYDVYVQEAANGYIVYDLDDPQLVDDATNHEATTTALYTADQVRQAVLADRAKQAGQSEAVAEIEISVEGSTTTIDNHFSDAVRSWPEGKYKLYTTPQPSPVAQPVQDVGFVSPEARARLISSGPNAGRVRREPAPLAQPVNAELVEAWQSRANKRSATVEEQPSYMQQEIDDLRAALSRTQAAQPQQKEGE